MTGQDFSAQSNVPDSVSQEELNLLVERLAKASDPASGPIRTQDIAEAMGVSESEVQRHLAEIRSTHPRPMTQIAPEEQKARRILTTLVPVGIVLFIVVVGAMIFSANRRSNLAVPGSATTAIDVPFATTAPMPIVEHAPAAMAHTDFVSVPSNVSYKLGSVYLDPSRLQPWTSLSGLSTSDREQALNQGLFEMIRQWTVGESTSDLKITQSAGELQIFLRDGTPVKGAFEFRTLTASHESRQQSIELPIALTSDQTVQEAVLAEQRRRIREFANKFIYEWPDSITTPRNGH